MAADYSTICEGDTVKVCIDKSIGYGGSYPVWLTESMKEFDGEEFIVSRIYGSSQKAYELKGVNNKHGVPYTWMKEALVKVNRIASGNDAKVDDALMKATLSEYAPIEELASYMGVRD